MNDKMIVVDGEFYKKHQVVMLATEGESKLNLHTETGLLRIGDDVKSLNKTAVNQNLFILSDEPAQVGEWVIDLGVNVMFQCKSSNFQRDGCSKVIATTDSSLGLPRPSDAFVQKFVEEYNKGNVITEVLVEPDNTITIKPVIETWDDIYSKINTSEFNSKIEVFNWLKENYQVPKGK